MPVANTNEKILNGLNLYNEGLQELIKKDADKFRHILGVYKTSAIYDECNLNWIKYGNAPLVLKDGNIIFEGQNCITYMPTTEQKFFPATTEIIVKCDPNDPEQTEILSISNISIGATLVPDKKKYFYVTVGNQTYYDTESINDEFYHIEIGDDNNNIYIFINGILKKTFTGIYSATLENMYMVINSFTGLGYSKLVASEFRITLGCLHTENFTPPSAPLSLDANTFSLLHFDY